jgi:hypothetical protein
MLHRQLSLWSLLLISLRAKSSALKEWKKLQIEKFALHQAKSCDNILKHLLPTQLASRSVLWCSGAHFCAALDSIKAAARRVIGCQMQLANSLFCAARAACNMLWIISLLPLFVRAAKCSLYTHGKVLQHTALWAARTTAPTTLSQHLFVRRQCFSRVGFPP